MIIYDDWQLVSVDCECDTLHELYERGVNIGYVYKIFEMPFEVKEYLNFLYGKNVSRETLSFERWRNEFIKEWDAMRRCFNEQATN